MAPNIIHTRFDPENFTFQLIPVYIATFTGPQYYYDTALLIFVHQVKMFSIGRYN